eukprot:scaffold218826_cov32-Attheya_sp.AAC.1
MNILNSIWGQDGKYAYNDSIQRCLRKSDILPSTWMMDINNDVGSASMSNKLKRISDEDCNDLCSSMKNLLTKVTNTRLDLSKEEHVLQGSFVEESFDDSELRAMAEEWVDVESDVMVQEAEIEEVIEQLESEQNTTNDYDYISDLDKDDTNTSDDDELLHPISFTDAMDSFEKLKRYGLSL